jgi:hypothetical protein
MMDAEKKELNLTIYNNVREVPAEAKKNITGGRLNGMTDINPMWRIKTLTEQFGVCGIGWKASIQKLWLEDGANSEKMAFCHIHLFIKVDGKWSEPIDGIGGSAFIAKERSGLYTSDECFKMAYTDAISVACKALGVGADVYYAKDRTKYDQQKTADEKPNIEVATRDVNNAKDLDELKTVWERYPALHGDAAFKKFVNEKKAKLPTV